MGQKLSDDDVRTVVQDRRAQVLRRVASVCMREQSFAVNRTFGGDRIAPHALRQQNPCRIRAVPSLNGGATGTAGRMTRDRGLEAVLADDLSAEPGLSAKSMFGGWAWLLNGNLLCCARHDGMLARVGLDRAEWALALPGIAPMYSGSRRMAGWVRASADAWGDDARRRELLAAALTFTRTLPPKRKARGTDRHAANRRRS